MKGVKNFVENIFTSRSTSSIRSNNDEFQRLSSFDYNQINEGVRESCVSLQSEQHPRPGTTAQQSEIELKSLPLKLKEENNFDQESGHNSRDDGSAQSNSGSNYNHEYDNEFRVYNPTSVELPDAFTDETFPLALSDVRLAIKDFVTGERNENPATVESNLNLASSSESSCCKKFISSACTSTSGKDHAVILCLFLIPLGCLFFGLVMVGWNRYNHSSLNDESNRTDLHILKSLQWPLHDVKSRRANITFKSKDGDHDSWNFQTFEAFIKNAKQKNETSVASANANINRNEPPKFNGHEIDENILMESYDVSRRFIDGKLSNGSSKLEIILWRGVQGEVLLEELRQRLNVSQTNGSIEGEFHGPLCYNDSEHRINCNKTAWFRSADGSCNNVLSKNYGSLYAPFRTIINHDNQIGDSFVNFSDTLSGEQRQDPESSLLLPLWGMFLLHDTVKIPDSPIKCCNDGISIAHTLENRKTCYKFQSMKDNELNDEYKCASIHHPPAIFPSCIIEDHGTSFNLVTSFIDASNIYGSTEEITDKLREKSSGQMKVFRMKRKGTAQHNKSSIFAHEKSFLQPVLGQNHTCPFGTVGNFGDGCVLSGDDDVNQIAHITALNTILLRQHNWLAYWLHHYNPHWNDERLFQECRRILIAQIQHITYNEFLPEIIGKDLMNSSDLSLNNEDFYNLYDPAVDASISTVYASAVGHFVYSMTAGNVKLLWKKGKYLRLAQYDIRKLIYFLPKHNSALGALILGATRTNANKVGIEFPMELQSMHLERKNSTVNLVKIIIDRGRELGLAPYVEWRKVCGLPDIESFDDLHQYWYPEAFSKIKTAYKNVKEVDLFLGMLAENPLPSARVGPTLACLLADQFLRFKMGDRHWYEGNVNFHHFSSEQLDVIRQTTLARLLCDNTEDNFNEIQKWPMLITKESNPTLSCSDPQIPPFDFSPWKENSPNRKLLHVTVRKHTMNSDGSEELTDKFDDELYDSDENNLKLQ